MSILKRTRLLRDFKKVLVFKCKTIRQLILFGFAFPQPQCNYGLLGRRESEAASPYHRLSLNVHTMRAFDARTEVNQK